MNIALPDSLAHQYNNAAQTPMNINYEFVKSIKVLTDKMRNELNADEPKLDRRTSATPYALRPSIMSPANKYAPRWSGDHHPSGST